MKELVKIMRGIKRLLFLKGTKNKGSVLSRKIKTSGKTEKKFKQGASSVLSARIY